MNASQTREKRFWERWEAAGAVGYAQPRPFSEPRESMVRILPTRSPVTVTADFRRPIHSCDMCRLLQAAYDGRPEYPVIRSVRVKEPIRREGHYTVDVFTKRGQASAQVHVVLG